MRVILEHMIYTGLAGGRAGATRPRAGPGDAARAPDHWPSHGEDVMVGSRGDDDDLDEVVAPLPLPIPPERREEMRALEQAAKHQYPRQDAIDDLPALFHDADSAAGEGTP
jgi:hypothetical protein